MNLEYSKEQSATLGNGVEQQNGWSINANKWDGSEVDYIPVTDDMKVTKDLDESYEIWERRKLLVHIYKGDNSSDNYVKDIRMMKNSSLAMVNNSGYLDNLLAELGYERFETIEGGSFTKDTIVTEDITIIAIK